MRYYIILIFIFLVGCESTSYKKAPVEIIGEEKIRITIDSPQLLEKKTFFAFRNFTSWVEVDFHHGELGCPWDGLHESKESYMFTVKLDRSKPKTTIHVPFNAKYKKLYALINDSNGVTICPQNISFQTEKNHEYFLTIKGHSNPSSRCMTFLKSKHANEKITRKPIKWTAPKNIFMGLYTYDAICQK